MESVDPMDKHLDPPDEPEYSRCTGCGDYFPQGDLTGGGTPGNRRWLCGDCCQDEFEDNEEMEE